VAENGRYKFLIYDAAGDGIDDDEVKFDFDYSLIYSGTVVAQTNEFEGGGFATHFGEGSCCGKGEKLVEVKINTDKFPGQTSWEILDACSEETVIGSGAFDGEDFYQSSNEVCVAENGRYKFLISDSALDGIDDFRVPFDFDYKLLYSGMVMAQTNEFEGSGFVIYL